MTPVSMRTARRDGRSYELVVALLTIATTIIAFYDLYVLLGSLSG